MLLIEVICVQFMTFLMTSTTKSCQNSRYFFCMTDSLKCHHFFLYITLLTTLLMRLTTQNSFAINQTAFLFVACVLFSCPWYIFDVNANCHNFLKTIFCRSTDTRFGLLMTSPLGFKARAGSLIRPQQRCTCYTFPEIHLWCNTC